MSRWITTEELETIGRWITLRAEEVEQSLPRWMERPPTPPAEQVQAEAARGAVIAATPRTFEAQATVFAALVRTRRLALSDLPPDFRERVVQTLGSGGYSPLPRPTGGRP